MNVLFFLKPKNEVQYVYDTYSIRQVMEKMEAHRYTSIPILSEDGRYVGTITEGDLLWHIKREENFNLSKAQNKSIHEVNRNKDNDVINATSQMEDIIALSINQNFVPVVDDRNYFIGIITRKDIISYLNKTR